MKELKHEVEALYVAAPGSGWRVIAAFRYDSDADDFVRNAEERMKTEPKDDQIKYRRS